MAEPAETYAANLAIYEAVVAAHLGLAPKGKKMPYTALNGNMFSFLDPDGRICVRLAKEDVAAFNAKYGTGPVVQYGAVMKEYVALPQAVIDDSEQRSALFAQSLAFARTLKPKPTKR